MGRERETAGGEAVAHNERGITISVLGEILRNGIKYLQTISFKKKRKKIHF